MSKGLKKLFKKIDKIVFVFMVLGLFVIFETRSMYIGNLEDPGPGLFPLFLGIIILILSFIKSFISNGKKIPESSERITPRNIYYILGSLLFFRFSVPIFGYSITTFSMFVFLLKIVGGKKWFFTIAWSIIITGISYLIFVKWLMVLFPEGILLF